MARIGMQHFVKLAFSFDRMKRALDETEKRGGNSCTVSTEDLRQVVHTFGNFDVQILNKRSSEEV